MAAVEVYMNKLYFSKEIDLARSKELIADLRIQESKNTIHNNYTHIGPQTIIGNMSEVTNNRKAILLINLINLTPSIIYRYTPYDPSILTIEEFKISRDHVQELADAIHAGDVAAGTSLVESAIGNINRNINIAGLVAKIIRRDWERYYNYFKNLFEHSTNILVGFGSDPITAYLNQVLSELDEFSEVPTVS